MRLAAIVMTMTLLAGGYAWHAMAGDACPICPAPDGKATPTTAPATQASAGPVNKFCPINTDEAINPRLTIVQDGKVIGFCCKDCIREFRKDPAKYMAAMR